MPQIEIGKSFRYLGRYFNYDMSDQEHKSALLDVFDDIMNKIDELPLHPKNKILLYSRYLFSKISWHFTVSDISKTWICETLDSIASKYIRKWLQLPISATLSNVLLPHNKFGLNIILPSTKFVQYQTVARTALNFHQTKILKIYGQSTSTNKTCNMIYTKTQKSCSKAVRNENEERLQKHLIAQGSFFTSVNNHSTSKFNSLWSSVQSNLPKNIFNFTIRYINNTLPTRKKPIEMGTVINI